MIEDAQKNGELVNKIDSLLVALGVVSIDEKSKKRGISYLAREYYREYYKDNIAKLKYDFEVKAKEVEFYEKVKKQIQRGSPKKELLKYVEFLEFRLKTTKLPLMNIKKQIQNLANALQNARSDLCVRALRAILKNTPILKECMCSYMNEYCKELSEKNGIVKDKMLDIADLHRAEIGLQCDEWSYKYEIIQTFYGGFKAYVDKDTFIDYVVDYLIGKPVFDVEVVFADNFMIRHIDFRFDNDNKNFFANYGEDFEDGKRVGYLLIDRQSQFRDNYYPNILERLKSCVQKDLWYMLETFDRVEQRGVKFYELEADKLRTQRDKLKQKLLTLQQNKTPKFNLEISKEEFSRIEKIAINQLKTHNPSLFEAYNHIKQEVAPLEEDYNGIQNTQYREKKYNKLIYKILKNSKLWQGTYGNINMGQIENQITVITDKLDSIHSKKAKIRQLAKEKIVENRELLDAINFLQKEYETLSNSQKTRRERILLCSLEIEFSKCLEKIDKDLQKQYHTLCQKECSYKRKLIAFKGAKQVREAIIWDKCFKNRHFRISNDISPRHYYMDKEVEFEQLRHKFLEQKEHYVQEIIRFYRDSRSFEAYKINDKILLLEQRLQNYPQELQTLLPKSSNNYHEEIKELLAVLRREKYYTSKVYIELYKLLNLLLVKQEKDFIVGLDDKRQEIQEKLYISLEIYENLALKSYKFIFRDYIDNKYNLPLKFEVLRKLFFEYYGNIEPINLQVNSNSPYSGTYLFAFNPILVKPNEIQHFSAWSKFIIFIEKLVKDLEKDNVKKILRIQAKDSLNSTYYVESKDGLVEWELGNVFASWDCEYLG